MFLETRSLFASRTVWMALITTILSVLTVVGVFKPDQAPRADGTVPTTQESIDETAGLTADQIVALITTATSLLAIYFRKTTANAPLTLLGGPVITKTPMVLLLVFGAGLSAVGCTSRAELIGVREAMNQGTSTIRQQHLEWTHALAPVQDDAGNYLRDDQGNFVYRSRDELPKLYPEDVTAATLAHEEYNAAVEESRKGDRLPLPGR